MRYLHSYIIILLTTLLPGRMPGWGKVFQAHGYTNAGGLSKV